MTEQNQSIRKTRKRRSPEKMAELVFEAERIGASAVCRRKGIAPAQLSRWKQKFMQAGITGLRDTNRGSFQPPQAPAELLFARLATAKIEPEMSGLCPA